MSKSLSLFDWLYKATDKAVDALKLPHSRKIVRRAIESFSDEVEVKKIELEAALDDQLRKLVRAKDENEAKRIIAGIIERESEVEVLLDVATSAKYLGERLENAVPDAYGPASGEEVSK